MIKNFFIKQGLKEAEIEAFIRKEFTEGDYSKIELQRTPLGTRIVIHTNKPGRIIGKGGEIINKMTDSIRAKFELENPQLDVKSIESPDLDAKIVAKQIASALERGYNYKKIGNLTIKRIMRAGAIGTEIIINGKVSGSKASRNKFVEGYIKQAGQPAKDMVDIGFETAEPPAGTIGVTVKIMTKIKSDFIKKNTKNIKISKKSAKKKIAKKKTKTSEKKIKKKSNEKKSVKKKVVKKQTTKPKTKKKV